MSNSSSNDAITFHENQDRNLYGSKLTWNPEVTPDKELIWDEYKHRHDLCWRLIFQLTYAVVIISIVPYIKPDIANQLGYWIVALPVIGIALTLFGLARLRREVGLLAVIRARHREMQGLSDPYPDKETRISWLQRFLGRSQGEETRFSWDATAYLICLLALGIVNTYVILFIW